MVLYFLRIYFPKAIYMALYMQQKCLYSKETINSVILPERQQNEYQVDNHHSIVSKVYGL